MNSQMPVVVDEAELPELVHEGVDPGARRADDFGQRLLADLGRDRSVRAKRFSLELNS